MIRLIYRMHGEISINRCFGPASWSFQARHLSEMPCLAVLSSSSQSFCRALVSVYWSTFVVLSFALLFPDCVFLVLLLSTCEFYWMPLAAPWKDLVCVFRLVSKDDFSVLESDSIYLLGWRFLLFFLPSLSSSSSSSSSSEDEASSKSNTRSSVSLFIVLSVLSGSLSAAYSTIFPSSSIVRSKIWKQAWASGQWMQTVFFVPPWRNREY